MSVQDDQQFIKVVRRTGPRKKMNPPYAAAAGQPKRCESSEIEIHCRECSREADEDETFKGQIKVQLHNLKQNLKESEYYKGFYDLLCQSFASLKEIGEPRMVPLMPTKIVCYGIGNFSEDLIPRYQLAFIMVLRDELNIPMELYDPALTIMEKNLLADTYHIKIIPDNEEGKRSVDESLTLFYLPHLPNQLVNNLLFANWSADKLRNCILVSNSFQAVKEADVTEEYSFIGRTGRICEEFSVMNSFEYKDIFNNTSIHAFPLTKLSLVTDDFWFITEPPVYAEEDFISCKLSTSAKWNNCLCEVHTRKAKSPL